LWDIFRRRIVSTLQRRRSLSRCRIAFGPSNGNASRRGGSVASCSKSRWNVGRPTLAICQTYPRLSTEGALRGPAANRKDGSPHSLHAGVGHPVRSFLRQNRYCCWCCLLDPARRLQLSNCLVFGFWVNVGGRTLHTKGSRLQPQNVLWHFGWRRELSS
jgi:hypothetical protein